MVATSAILPPLSAFVHRAVEQVLSFLIFSFVDVLVPLVENAHVRAIFLKAIPTLLARFSFHTPSDPKIESKE